MYPYYYEFELIKPVEDYLRCKGFKIKKEVRIGYCRADIVGFKKNIVLSIELKMNNWKKAIIQAKNYQLGSDFVYIAFPLQRIHCILRKAELNLKNNGIGLLSINEKTSKVKIVINAKKSKKMMARINFGKNCIN
jgi:hypothetical protein